MSDWIETGNGNFVYPMGDDGVMTVFQTDSGDWGGVLGGAFLRGKADSAEEAMELMEMALTEIVLNGKSRLLQTPDSGWHESKKGGFYRNTAHGILSVKQARSGSWYISLNSRMLKDVWCRSAEEARHQGDQHLRALDC